MSSDPIAVVRSFFDELGKPGNLMVAIDGHAADDCVWENSGLPTAEGVSAMKDFMQQFVDTLNMQALVVELRAMSADGDTVLTERVDHFEDGDGQRVGSVAVSGSFDVRDGKIVAWRDYFDPRPFLPPN